MRPCTDCCYINTSRKRSGNMRKIEKITHPFERPPELILWAPRRAQVDAERRVFPKPRFSTWVLWWCMLLRYWGAPGFFFPILFSSLKELATPLKTDFETKKIYVSPTRRVMWPQVHYEKCWMRKKTILGVIVPQSHWQLGQKVVLSLLVSWEVVSETHSSGGGVLSHLPIAGGHSKYLVGPTVHTKTYMFPYFY